MSRHRSAFKKLFRETARQSNRYSVFRDWVFCVSIAIENAFLKCPKKEADYLKIVGNYKKDDVERFAKMHAELVMALEETPGDILGELFMELEISSSHLGQYFTPFSISKALSELTFDSSVEQCISTNGYISVSEPACGSGGMIVAFSETMRERGYNPQRQAVFHVVDLDPVAARMAYIQLSVMGLVAKITVGNTLSLEFTETMKTPGGYMWGSKLQD